MVKVVVMVSLAVCGVVMCVFVSYDHISLDIKSRDSPNCQAATGAPRWRAPCGYALEMQFGMYATTQLMCELQDTDVIITYTPHNTHNTT